MLATSMLGICSVKNQQQQQTICACRSGNVREYRSASSATRLLASTSSSVSQASNASEGERMEQHGKEAGVTHGSHGGSHRRHLLTPSGVAAELRLEHEPKSWLSSVDPSYLSVNVTCISRV